MLYRIGLVSEIPTLPSSIPKQVRTEIMQGLVVLDCEYGDDRNYLESGGCSIMIENADDLELLKAIVDYISTLASGLPGLAKLVTHLHCSS